MNIQHSKCHNRCRRILAIILIGIGSVFAMQILVNIVNPAIGLNKRLLQHMSTSTTPDSAPCDLAEMVPAEWDKACIFGPYTRNKQINAAIGFDWQCADSRELESSDWGCLIVFVKGNKVVGYATISRSDCDFAKAAGCYSRKDALFRLVTTLTDANWKIAIPLTPQTGRQ